LTTAGFGTNFTINSVPSALEKNGFVVSTRPGPGQVPADTVVTINVANGYVLIPDVTGGLNCQQASQKLTDKTLKPTCTQQPDNHVPQGQVIGVQNESPGQPILRGSQVTVLVSSGPGNVAVPPVVGEQQADARAQLKQAGFKVLFVRDPTCDQTLDGTVESQNPQPGTQAPYGSNVTLTVWKFDQNNPNCGGPTT
jgi:serine/threonine-protein kinase